MGSQILTFLFPFIKICVSSTNTIFTNSHFNCAPAQFSPDLPLKTGPDLNKTPHLKFRPCLFITVSTSLFLQQQLKNKQLPYPTKTNQATPHSQETATSSKQSQNPTNRRKFFQVPCRIEQEQKVLLF